MLKYTPPKEVMLSLNLIVMCRLYTEDFAIIRHFNAIVSITVYVELL